MPHLHPQLLNRRSRQGFTLLELIMMFIIIVLIASISYSPIQSALRQGILAKEREWVRGFVMAAENYHADTGGFPMSLADLTGASPPYITDALAAKCGTMNINGGVRTFHSCNFNTIQFHYLFQFTQWDLNVPAKIPPKVIEYNELTTKIPWDTGVCGIIPAGTKYFYEFFEGKVTNSGCG